MMKLTRADVRDVYVIGSQLRLGTVRYTLQIRTRQDV